MKKPIKKTSEEHVALLKQGMTVWNEWRRENPDINPDLFEANLRPNPYTTSWFGSAIYVSAGLT